MARRHGAWLIGVLLAAAVLGWVAARTGTRADWSKTFTIDGLALGASKDEVRRAWGQPGEVKTLAKTEVWTYRSMTPDVGSRSVVFFAGRAQHIRGGCLSQDGTPLMRENFLVPSPCPLGEPSTRDKQMLLWHEPYATVPSDPIPVVRAMIYSEGYIENMELTLQKAQPEPGPR